MLYRRIEELGKRYYKLYYNCIRYDTRIPINSDSTGKKLKQPRIENKLQDKEKHVEGQ